MPQDGARVSRACPEMGSASQNCRLGWVSTLVFRRRLRYQPRMANESIDKLARTLAESVPGAMRSVRDDLEQMALVLEWPNRFVRNLFLVWKKMRTVIITQKPALAGQEVILVLASIVTTF